MAYTTINPEEFLTTAIFQEDDFIPIINSHDWQVYHEKHVLVRGCSTVPVPQWAYMMIMAKLVDIAKSVRYGNEHDNIIVYRKNSKKET